jgi:hypothetical protein
MPRSLTADYLTALASAAKRIAFFVQIVYSNETIYVWSGIGPYTWNGHTWTGLGWLGEISAIPMTTQVQAQSVTLTLSGIPSELLSDTLDYVRITGTATIWLGLFDDSWNLIDGTAVQVFNGALDVPTVTDGGDTCSISITCENTLIDLERAPYRRYTDVDQQIDFPGDLGMSFVQNLQEENFIWPDPAVT